MCVNLFARSLRSAPLLALLFVPFVAAPAGAQAPPPAAPIPTQADQELTKLRAEVTSLRQQLALKEQALARANADLGTARAEQAGNKAVLDQTRANLASTRKALANAAAEREVLRRDLTAQLATCKAELVKTREVEAAARKELTDALSARDTALRGLAAMQDRVVKAENQLQLDKAVLASTREKLELLERNCILVERDLEKSRLHLSDVSFPCPQHGKARFVIEVPTPDVELYVDGKKLDVIDGKVVREFTSTTLETGKRYTLSLQAKMMRDGKVLTATRQLVFKPDNEYRLYLDPRATPSSGE